ncbi:MAG: hypothetical protein AAB229_09595, partial [Candidatus Hydrogenedentota bacterium]
GRSSAALDDQESVPMSLTVSGSASLSIQPKNVGNNGATSSLTFSLPASGETLSLSSQYVEVAFNTNFDNWNIKTYTSSGRTTDGNFWGALIGPDTAYKMYLRWKVADALGTPALSSGNWNSWTLYKDPADPDWDYNSTYLNIANGGAWEGGWSQLADGSACSSPIHLYVAGSTTGLVPGTYQNQMYLDFIHL